MAPVVAFVGYHNSGKTTFATKVVEILVKRGYRVAVLKSTKHREVIKDREGTDTYRYKEAGAGAVGLVEPDRLTLFMEIEEREPLYLAFLLFGDYDLVVCEGFKGSQVPKFEVVRKEFRERALYRNLENLIGVVSDFPLEDREIRRFSIERPEEVADFIEEEFLKEREKTALFVNGKKVPLKRFVQESLKGVIEGYIGALKGIESPIKKVEVRFKVDKEGSI